MQAITRVVTHGRAELAKIIVGQSELIDGALIALLCGGHALIEGVPGLGKTLGVKTLARCLNVAFQRIQCTSDLMPADLLGTNVLNLTNGTFTLQWSSTGTLWYQVSYSSDMIHWNTSPPVQANSGQTSWTDTGPPVTNIAPSDPSVTRRFYLLNQIPAP